jgi:hypothetical protein
MGPLIPLLLATTATGADPLAAATADIAAETAAHARTFDDLTELTEIGPRLSGSPAAAQAVAWAQAKLASLGLDRVYLQPAKVPHWTRGAVETASLRDKLGTLPLAVTALGGSVGTPKGGLEAEVVEVRSLADVDALGDAVRGKIVFYNRPMDPNTPNTFDAYGAAVDQRTSGPARAAARGAVAALVRTLTTLPDDDHPHSGVTRYRDGTPEIPAAAVSTHGANELSRRLAADPHLKVRLTLGAERFPDVDSFNVVGELRGRDLPDEIVDVGGHLDSWDLGVGAHDDGTGVVQSIEVLRSLVASGHRPRRTVRVVLFMCEEFGGIGAASYANAASAAHEKHIAALESDRGGFAPRGFSAAPGSRGLALLAAWQRYLAPLHADAILHDGAGTDVEPLERLGAVTFDYVPAWEHYFDYHHSALDQLAVVDPDEVRDGAAAMGALVYLLAEAGTN